jgi:hypothetical protein
MIKRNTCRDTTIAAVGEGTGLLAYTRPLSIPMRTKVDNTRWILNTQRIRKGSNTSISSRALARWILSGSLHMPEGGWMNKVDIILPTPKSKWAFYFYPYPTQLMRVWIFEYGDWISSGKYRYNPCVYNQAPPCNFYAGLLQSVISNQALKWDWREYLLN